MFGGFSFFFKIIIVLTSGFKQLPKWKYHISHTKDPLALSHPSPQEACVSQGQRKGGVTKQ